MRCRQLRKYSPYLGNFLVISVTMTHNIQRLSERFQQLLRAFVRFAEQRHCVGLCCIGHSWGGPSSFRNVSITCKWKKSDVVLPKWNLSSHTKNSETEIRRGKSMCIDCQSKYFTVLIFLQQTPVEARSLVIFTYVLF